MRLRVPIASIAGPCLAAWLACPALAAAGLDATAPPPASSPAPSAAPTAGAAGGVAPRPGEEIDPLGALLAKMSAVNPGVRSYEAAITVNVVMRTFPYLRPTLTGHVYWEHPDRSAVVFDTLPGLAGEFKKIYPHIDAPSRWESIYRVTLLAPFQVRLVPRKHGRVDHADVRVNPDGTIASMHWYYNDGGDVSMHQSFATIDGHRLVSGQRIRVELPSYKGDIQAAFSDYKVNVSIPESVFTPS
ncbi:MAG TPA: hypothetical protein VNJ51_14310 [Candidatus Dormibacteraeota bacterium]|nr:hypothetical protein [Candidatus Dormibacteraeota bacterium]